MKPNINDYQALLFDVDSTLLTTQKEFPEGLLSLLGHLSKKGLIIGLCTGRGYQGLVNTVISPLVNAGISGKHIIAGGAQIIESNGKMIEGVSIDSDVIARLHQFFLNETQRRVIFTGLDIIFINDAYLDEVKQAWQSNLQPLSSYNSEEIYIINVNHLEINNSLPDLDNCPVNINLMRPHGLCPCMDITSNKVNKGYGVKRWAKLNNISTRQIIGFGDSANDIELLREVGFAVAMGNACEELKKQADLVIGHVNDNGLLKFLLELLEE